MQVSSTAGVAVGRWVRLFAQSPSAVAPPALRRLLSEDASSNALDSVAADEQQQVEVEQAEVVIKLTAQQLGIEADDWDSLIDQLLEQIEKLPGKLRYLLQQVLSGGQQPGVEHNSKGGSGGKHRHGGSGRRGGSGRAGSGSGSDDQPGGDGNEGSNADEDSKPAKSSKHASKNASRKSSRKRSPKPSPTPAPKPSPTPTEPVSTDAADPTSGDDVSSPPSSGDAPILPRNGTAGACADSPSFLPLTESLREGCLDAEALGLTQPEEPPAANSTNSTSDGSGDKAPGLAAGGTLDAYLYGRQAGAASGTGERWSGWLLLVRLVVLLLRASGLNAPFTTAAAAAANLPHCCSVPPTRSALQQRTHPLCIQVRPCSLPGLPRTALPLTLDQLACCVSVATHDLLSDLLLLLQGDRCGQRLDRARAAPAV